VIRGLLSRYRAAVFDLDGTLADSMRIWDHICRDWLSARSIDAAESLERDIAAMTLTQSAGYVIREYGITLSPPEIIKEWERAVLCQYAHTLPLKEGAVELVKNLAACGMKLAIVTSCFPAACEAILSRYDLWDRFSAVIYTDEAGRGKAFPDIYRLCAERLGVEPASCVVFEDCPAALCGVRAAGMGLAAVYDDSSAAHWEAFSGAADFAVKNLLLDFPVKTT
jgi:HAD superfamily hydrolase (TIGR01509 family)